MSTKKQKIMLTKQVNTVILWPKVQTTWKEKSFKSDYLNLKEFDTAFMLNGHCTSSTYKHFELHVPKISVWSV